jgi:hypothetical protein
MAQRTLAPLAAVLGLLAATWAEASPAARLAAEGTGGAPDLAPRAAPAPVASTVAILVLSGEEAGIPLSEMYARARGVIEAHTALNVAALDVLGLAERDAAIRDCAGNAACFASKVRAQAASIGLLLTVSVDRLDEGLLLGFRLVDVRSEEQIGASGDEIPVGMSLVGALEQQLPEVFPRSIWDQIAAVSIETEPANAEVTVAGRSCVSPCELARLVPGVHEVTVRKEGYLQWSGAVELAAGRTTVVRAVLEAPKGSFVASPLFWGVLGAVVAGAVAASYLALQPEGPVESLCIARRIEDCGF